MYTYIQMVYCRCYKNTHALESSRKFFFRDYYKSIAPYQQQTAATTKSHVTNSRDRIHNFEFLKEFFEKGV